MIEIPRDVLLTIIGTVAGAVIGFFIGLRTNFVIGRVFEFRAFLNQALFEVRLMSGRMKKDSADFCRLPRADQAVRLYADQIDTIGQPACAAAMREIAEQMEAKFAACQPRDTDLDFHDDKGRWVSTLAELKPRWLPFLQKR